MRSRFTASFLKKPLRGFSFQLSLDLTQVLTQVQEGTIAEIEFFSYRLNDQEVAGRNRVSHKLLLQEFGRGARFVVERTIRIGASRAAAADALGFAGG